MQGSFFVVLLGVVALCAVLLVTPVRLRLRGATIFSGGRGEALFRWLGFRIRVPLRLVLLGETPPRLEFLYTDGTVRGRVPLTGKEEPPSPWESAFERAAVILRADVTIMIGIAEAPALTAQLCGAVHSALTIALPLLWQEAPWRVFVMPSYTQDALRMEIVGIARVHLGKLILYRMRNRGE